MAALPEVDTILAALSERLGDRLKAVYLFGTRFGRGPRAVKAQLLVLVEQIDRALLDDAVTLTGEARDLKLSLRFDIAQNIFNGADVFPVFTIDLIDNRSLLFGVDLLQGLEVHPKDLRVNIEHSLRAIKRDLIRVYLNSVDPRERAFELRRQGRKLVFLLEATLIVSRIPLPSPASPSAFIAALAESTISSEDAAIWTRVMRFTDFQDALNPDELATLYCALFDALANLTGLVDVMAVD